MENTDICEECGFPRADHRGNTHPHPVEYCGYCRKHLNGGDCSCPDAKNDQEQEAFAAFQKSWKNDGSRLIVMTIPPVAEETPWTVAGKLKRNAKEAEQALDFFARLTGQVEEDEREAVFADLLTNLMHMDNESFWHAMDKAGTAYAEESSDARREAAGLPLQHCDPS